MADVQIAHAFVTTKPDSSDPALVSANEWNAFLKFINGNPGQIPVRDGAAATGARWTQGVTAYSASGSNSGVAATTPLGPITLTFATSCTLLVAINVAIPTSAGQTVFGAVRRDGVGIRSYQINGDGFNRVPLVDVFTELPGTHTFDSTFSVASGLMTTVSCTNCILVFGN